MLCFSMPSAARDVEQLQRPVAALMPEPRWEVTSHAPRIAASFALAE